jgi:nucleoside 2-deoxyribosyltransferase
MKVYVVCPVRHVTAELNDRIAAEVASLEAAGHEVHWPMRDTDQHDTSGFRICRDNRAAIEAADEIHVIWDGHSQGSLFDLGMAFALRKHVVVVAGCFPDPTPGKGIHNVVHAWARAGAGA